MTSRTTQRSNLMLLFDQVFSDEELIAPKQYLMTNVVAGVILALWGTALLLEPTRPSGSSAALLASGVLLVALVLIGVMRQQVLRRTLVVQGLVVSALGVSLAFDTIHWAVTAPPHAMFRYLPGAIAVAFTYGMLQIAAFGPISQRASTVRIAGLIAGVALELVAAGFVLVRALH